MIITIEKNSVFKFTGIKTAKQHDDEYEVGHLDIVNSRKNAEKIGEDKMGVNLISACHRCKVKIFHFRGEENKTILPFYKKHGACAKLNIHNVQTVMDNNGTDQNWAESEEQGGYRDDELQE
jgi:hypothetical protein